MAKELITDLSFAKGQLLNAGIRNDAPGDPAIDNSFDTTVLQFDFVPDGNSFSFRYVFASEEYPEYACNILMMR
ncbi:MAG: choice-of-anchor L domain-containing protein [Bacteroidota bacterium]